MKKIILPLAVLLGTFSARASQIVIENNLPLDVCIQMFSAVNPSIDAQTANYEFVQPYDCFFQIASMDTFYFTNGQSSNMQFPFVIGFPYLGNVTGYGGTLPLPPTADDSPQNTSGERYVFEYMKFRVEGGRDTGFGPVDDYNNDPFGNQAHYSSTLPQLPTNPTYSVDFVRMGDLYYFGFNL